MTTTTIVWEDDLGAEVSVILDSYDSESHEFTSTITDHPVESGEDISDNILTDLDVFNLVGYVSDSPMSGAPGVEDLARFEEVEIQIPAKPVRTLLEFGADLLGAGSETQTVKVTMLRFENLGSRKRAVFDLLDEARRSKRECRILTDVKDYDGMFIRGITVTRIPGDGDGATFALAFREVKTVSSDLTVAPAPAETSGSQKKKAGAKGSKNDDAKSEESKKSLLKKIVDKGVDFFT